MAQSTITYQILKSRRECHYCSGSVLSICDVEVVEIGDDFPCDCYKEGFDIYAIRFYISKPKEKRPSATIEYLKDFHIPKSFYEFEFQFDYDDFKNKERFESELCITEDTEMTIAMPLLHLIEEIFAVQKRQVQGQFSELVKNYTAQFENFTPNEDKNVPERLKSICARWLAIVFVSLSITKPELVKPNPHVARKKKRA